MTQKEFSAIAHTIPVQPGIYKYYDAANLLLYVGKAKHLRKRVSSYFSKTFTTYKTHELVKRIHHIEFTIVNNEQDAFLLENTLIKEFQPKFNISLKDDKTYPYIVIKNEPFPRVFFTRRKINDGSQYLGPYTSVEKVRELLDFIRQTILLRTCKLNLTDNNIKKGKFKVCLEYHLGNCKGPCEGLQTTEGYNEELQQLVNILKGNIASPLLENILSFQYENQPSKDKQTPGQARWPSESRGWSALPRSSKARRRLPGGRRRSRRRHRNLPGRPGQSTAPARKSLRPCKARR